jgi:heat shock protein HtpX
MKFISRSLVILLLLYGLVFAIGDWYLAKNGAPLWFALIFAIAFIGLQYLVAPSIIEWFLDITWDETGTDLPAANREFIEKLCAERGLKVPRIGIIHSGTPNAFSFGHVPSDSRVVVTTGLLEILTPDESNAVIAHEIGHIEHWDFVVMTIAALAPLLLYQIYCFTDRINQTRAVAYAAYVCYIISQYVVLLLNRTREYWADHYSAEVTHAPGALSSALVKIAYGMVKADGEFRESIQNADKSEKASLRRAHGLASSLSVMGISNLRSGSALALSAANPADAAEVMRWDLANPWARFYELSSTHPLTAMRVQALNADSVAMQKAVEYPLPEHQHKNWGRFFPEFLVWVAPYLTGGILLSRWWFGEICNRFHIEFPPGTTSLLIATTAALSIVKIWFRYHGDYGVAKVGELIRDLDVSQMRPRAVRIKGKILGRGGAPIS